MPQPMQTFTRQQLQGDVRFNATCLIGNWSEDRDMQRTKLMNFLSKKETGRLALDAYQQRMGSALAEVPLTRVRDDPYVHFGDLFQIVHVDTGSTLACDVEDKDHRPGEQSCAATAAPDLRAPVARNTFLLAKYKPPRMSAFDTYYDDDVLRYGQKVRLVINPMATNSPLDSAGGPKPLCLYSRPLSTTHCAKYSRQQPVGFTYRHTYDTVWQVLTPDPSQRAVSEGVEVMAGAPILLMHCATQKPLCLEAQRYPNDFGLELEVTARNAAGHGLKLALEQTAQGVTKGFIPKGEQSDTHWTLITGPTVGTLPTPASSAFDTNNILASMNEDLMKTTGGISALEKKLVMLQNSRGEMAADEFLMVVRQVGITTPDQEIASLVRAFPGDQPRIILCRPFLQALKSVAC